MQTFLILGKQVLRNFVKKTVFENFTQRTAVAFFLSFFRYFVPGKIFLKSCKIYVFSVIYYCNFCKNLMIHWKMEDLRILEKNLKTQKKQEKKTTKSFEKKFSQVVYDIKIDVYLIEKIKNCILFFFLNSSFFEIKPRKLQD